MQAIHRLCTENLCTKEHLAQNERLTSETDFPQKELSVRMESIEHAQCRMSEDEIKRDQGREQQATTEGPLVQFSCRTSLHTNTSPLQNYR
jgi:hypothetical protein